MTKRNMYPLALMQQRAQPRNDRTPHAKKIVKGNLTETHIV
jgi:hypothetical protein